MDDNWMRGDNELEIDFFSFKRSLRVYVLLRLLFVKLFFLKLELYYLYNSIWSFPSK